MPNLSIIVPVYNVEKYLERCIKSILNQDYRDYELILVDDGSLDNSGPICDKYSKLDSRIITIHKKNGGLSSARNIGIRISKGEYIAFVDSDDWITKDMYSYMINLSKKYNADIVSVSYCLATQYHEKTTQGERYKGGIKVFSREQALLHYLSIGMNKRVSDFTACNKLYKQALFENYRFPEGKLYEDTATNFEIIKKVNTYVRSEKICYFYFQCGTSIVKSGFRLSNHTDLLLAGNQIVELSKDENIEIKKLAEEKKARTFFSSLSKIALYGYDKSVEDYKDIERNLLKNLRYNYIFLLHSSMPINRKLLMTLYCINFKVTKIIFYIYRVIKNKL